MSYSRWIGSIWYTFWCCSRSNKRTEQVFEVCSVKHFTYGELLEHGLDWAIEEIKPYAMEEMCNSLLTPDVYDELKIYMTRFMKDVASDTTLED